MKDELLRGIASPDDVKKLPPEQLCELCSEIRDCLITTVSQNGGHLASSLGAVELTVALHRSFSSPTDAILFDVGHQSYTHKLLTGRYDCFSTLRQENGLSGFMRPDESQHDPFITGHSSNSISAAYGIYKAKALRGEPGTAVAVIGDGAMTGGMAYEALNNAGSEKSKFIVVLNDNKMSISRNVGAMAKYLNRIRSRVGYHSFKNWLNRFLNKVPLFGKPLRDRLFSSKTMLKNAIYHSNIFEGLGFNYFGPVDGHDIKAMENLFSIAKNQNRPALIHVVTVKGKGYPFAESQPNLYHGVSAFDVQSGTSGHSDEDYSSVVGQTLCQMAESDGTVCAITAAMTSGTGLTEFASTYKDRFFDVGIAEEHAVTFSAGLAKGGMKPYFVVYSSFLQRGFDQVIHDAAIGGFDVRLCIDRAGVVGEDGETHQGLFDAAYLSLIPGVTIWSPASFDELKGMLFRTLSAKGVTAVRYPRGGQGDNACFCDTGAAADWFYPGHKTLVITYGRLSGGALEAVRQNAQSTLLKLNRIHPIDDALIKEIATYERVLFFEEGIRDGGIGEQLATRLLEQNSRCAFSLYAIDRFVPCAKTKAVLSHWGLDQESVMKALEGVKP